MIRAQGNHRTRTAEHGDTPTGVYKIDDWTNASDQCAYGSASCVLTHGLSGEIITAQNNGRKGIMIHSGRESDECKEGQTWIENDEPLQHTQGCVRMFENDLTDLKNRVDDLEQNDATEKKGNMTVTDDLIYDADTKSYLIKSEDKNIVESTVKSTEGSLENTLIHSSNKEECQKALDNFKSQAPQSEDDKNSCVRDVSIKADKSNVKAQE